jgi:hypothetical protein
MTEPTPSLDPNDHDLTALRAAEQQRRKRGLIFFAAVTELGNTWRALDKRLDAEVFGADPAKAAATRPEIEALRVAIAAQKAKSAGANLRFEPSRAELDAWFEHIDKELQVLDWLAASHGNPSPPAPPFHIREPERTPAQIRTSVVASIYDDLESFRVWHTSGMHPCGPAAP